MNFGPFVFIGVFCTMVISWWTFVFGPVKQLGSLQPETTVMPIGDTYPVYRTGAQKRGMDVYRANNCAACHTQQVRPTELGPDLMRGWGIRQRFSTAEDYLYEYPVMLGTQRVGPDLANVGSRVDERTVLLKLYNPRDGQLRAPGTVIPPYPFLFKKQKVGRNPSTDALPVNVEAGYEIVPTEDALAWRLTSPACNKPSTFLKIPRRHRRKRSKCIRPSTRCQQRIRTQNDPKRSTKSAAR